MQRQGGESGVYSFINARDIEHVFVPTRTISEQNRRDFWGTNERTQEIAPSKRRSSANKRVQETITLMQEERLKSLKLHY
jgi:hypothetical protein